eukprot:TRINITY_DN4206_c0_g1_i1.p1 TRINITY_DN4206_c0_g1~~TRINITY_DN4206_c0_g1_i1.p1  ORF type:complete len:116 (-),score=40.34 TRINITY_DN4206_c0_g1_i1:147-494(-)
MVVAKKRSSTVVADKQLDDAALEASQDGAQIVADDMKFNSIMREKKIAKIKDMFKQWDSDGSGFIDKDEMTALFQKLDPDWTTHQLEALFRAVDKNGDNVIDIDEFIDWLLKELM